jgi:hypothetical protein
VNKLTEANPERIRKSDRERDALQVMLDTLAVVGTRISKEEDWIRWETAIQH